VSLSPAQLESFVCELAASPEAWQDHVKPDHQNRVYAQIWDGEDVNAWVICWSEDHDTGFHDHDESAAAILVVSGLVREERLRVGGAPVGREIGPGAPFFVPPTAIHRVLHAGTGSAVTIHAYSPPLRRTGAYQVGPDGELKRISQPYEEELQARSTLT
jgi:mannose-6-phosphate isomerase-like protein (cupin superfamily)